MLCRSTRIWLFLVLEIAQSDCGTSRRVSCCARMIVTIPEGGSFSADCGTAKERRAESLRLTLNLHLSYPARQIDI